MWRYFNSALNILNVLSASYSRRGFSKGTLHPRKTLCLSLGLLTMYRGFNQAWSFPDFFIQVEEGLEQLSTVGSVTVVRNDVLWFYYGFEYVIEFQPWEGDDLSHYLNYGDMPSISVSEQYATLRFKMRPY